MIIMKLYRASKVFSVTVSCIFFFKRTINLENIVTQVFVWPVKSVRMTFDTFDKILWCPLRTNPHFGGISLKAP